MHALEKELAESKRLRLTVEGLQQQASLFQSRINDQTQLATQMQSQLHILGQTLAVAEANKKELEHQNATFNTKTLRLEHKVWILYSISLN